MMIPEIHQAEASGWEVASLRLADSYKHDDPKQGGRCTNDRSLAYILVGEARSKRQSNDQAEGAQRLDHHQASPFQGSCLQYPPTDLEYAANQPDRLAQDLRQEARVTSAAEVCSVPFCWSTEPRAKDKAASRARR